MLVAVLEEEVSDFLCRHRYERGKAFRGYRNGYHPSREITVGLGPVEVQVPRVAKIPLDVAPQGFQSQIVRRYQRASLVTQRLFCRLYLEGLATGDFEPVFRELVGETTALSANAIVRLKERWGKEYEVWRSRFLGNHRYAYIWADGVYLSAGMEKEKTALLCVPVPAGRPAEMAAAEVSCDFSIASTADFMVKNIFMPVSPSGTGKTFKELTSSICCSNCTLAASNASFKAWPSSSPSITAGIEHLLIYSL